MPAKIILTKNCGASSSRIPIQGQNAFLDEFAEALSQCDHVIITDIYAAREKDTGMVHARDLADKIEKTGTDVRYIKDFDAIEEFILKKCKKMIC